MIATGRTIEALKSLGADVAIALDGGEERPFLDQFAQGIDVVLDYLWGKSAEKLLIAGVPLDRMIAAIDGVLKAAVPAGFEIVTRPVPLSQMERIWADDTKARVVFYG